VSRGRYGRQLLPNGLLAVEQLQDTQVVERSDGATQVRRGDLPLRSLRDVAGVGEDGLAIGPHAPTEMVPVQVRQKHGVYVFGIHPGVLQICQQFAARTHHLRADSGIHQDRALRGAQEVRPDAPPEGVAVGESPRVPVNVWLPLLVRHTGEDLIQPEKSPLHVREGGDLDPPYLDAPQDQASSNLIN
jgi:hypothetical protein